MQEHSSAQKDYKFSQLHAHSDGSDFGEGPEDKEVQPQEEIPEDTNLLKQSQSLVSTSDLICLFALGCADSFAPYAPMVGISYFSHTVYKDPGIYVNICVAIYCAYPLVLFLQLMFDEYFDEKFGSYQAYSCRIVTNLALIASVAFLFPFLDGMYPNDDGTIPNEFQLILGTTLITAFSALLSGSVLQFVNFAHFPNSVGHNLTVFGQQIAGLFLAVVAIATDFNEHAKKENVILFFFITGIYTVLCMALFTNMAWRSPFYHQQLFLKDEECTSTVGNPSPSVIIFIKLLGACSTLFITIVTSCVLLSFYPRLGNATTAAWLVYIKFGSNGISRLIAKRLFFFKSQLSLFLSGLVRALCFIWFWDQVVSENKASDISMCVAIALWAGTDGLFCNWAYYFNGEVFVSKYNKNRGGSILNLVVALSLLASGVISIFLNSRLKTDRVAWHSAEQDQLN